MNGDSCARNILVVDDDRSIRESLADLLSDEGYLVTTASDGMDALCKLRGEPHRPCVILLDLMMPIMTGAQFYAELEIDPDLKTIPVVVISADGNVRQKAALFGGEYLPKPLRIESVLTVIERHCLH